MSARDHGMDVPLTPESGAGSDNSTRTGAGDGDPVHTGATVARPPVGEEPPRSRSQLRRALVGRGRRRLAVVVLLLVVVAVMVGVVFSTRSSSRKPAGGVPVTGVATVKRRDLVETDTESGTISHANPQTVYNRLSGTITSLPSIGQLIKPGQPLYELDSRPVILMNGTTPAYRDLRSGDSDGRDILQLNRNLVRLGFNPDGIVVDDVWQPATSAGVEALQASLGEPETGSLSPGQVVFLPGNRIVSALDASLGSTGGGAGGPSSAGGSTPASSVGGNGSATPILQTTSTQLIVTVDLDASKQSEAKVGETVTVEMPAGTIVDGVITGVSPVAASSSSSSSGPSSAPGSSSSAQATIPVTVKLKGHISGAGLDQAPVSVNFAQAVAKGVLSVPVTALLATPGGGYAVQEARAPHQLSLVTAGLFAAGYVQISGPGIYEGLQVTNSQG